MNEPVDKLAKYRPPGQRIAIQPAAQTSGRKQMYVPWKASTEAKRHLELRCKLPQPSECPLNSAITNVRGEWRRGLIITLSYGKSMMVVIKGRRLQELFQHIKDWKVEWIEEFDPRIHASLTDPQAPVVKSITLRTEPPEKAPPMEQRH